jgi:hypothetical protein
MESEQSKPNPPAACIRLVKSALAATGLCIAAVSCAHAQSGTMLDLEQPGAQAWPPQVQATQPSSDCSVPLSGTGTTFNVGPGQKFSELTEVPWLSLQAGDVVNIFHRPQPYRTKFGLRAQGTVRAPVIINGVTDAQCRRPEISGQDALTADDAAQARFFNKQHSENLGIIFIYQASSDPWGYKPRNIVIQNLKLSGAHKSNMYTAQDGSRAHYSLGAAGIYAVRVEGLTVQDNEISGNANGVFVNSRGDDDFSAYITLRRNRLQGNGNVGSFTEHNLYIQAMRVLYEGNFIGQLRRGAEGSSMKDRSSATVVRFNHIVAAARAIDLVEIEGGVAAIKDDPLYPNAWVFGNLIVSDHNLPGASSSLLIHWGGDNDPRYFRTGTLYFFNNTVVTRASQAQAYYLCVFDMPSQTQRVEAAANVFVHQGSSRFNLGYKSGTIVLRDTNWLSTGWAKGWDGEVVLQQSGARVLEGTDLALDEMFKPRKSFVGLDKGVRSVPSFAPQVSAVGLQPAWQFAAPSRLVERPQRGAAPDLGAMESN